MNVPPTRRRPCASGLILIGMVTSAARSRAQRALLSLSRRAAADLSRTCSARELSAAELTRVLDAFVVASSDSGGYTQGMADVVAWLLLHDLAGWQCFTILRSLVSRPLLRAAMSLDQACWDGISEVYANHLAPGVALAARRALPRRRASALFLPA